MLRVRFIPGQAHNRSIRRVLLCIHALQRSGLGTNELLTATNNPQNFFHEIISKPNPQKFSAQKYSVIQYNSKPNKALLQNVQVHMHTAHGDRHFNCMSLMPPYLRQLGIDLKLD